MNSGPAHIDDRDRQFCWQQIVRIRPLFRLSYPYAPKEHCPRLLALYALFSALEEAFSGASDESVTRAKLNWWQQQLLGPDYRHSEHPITRQLVRCNVIAPEAREHLLGCLATAVDRLNEPAPTSERGLKALCQSIGLYQMRLELALQGEHGTECASLTAACAANGLVQLLRESSRSEIAAYAWVPQDFLERHGVKRHELQQGTKPDSAGRLIGQLCALGLSWMRDESGPGSNHGTGIDMTTRWQQRHRHWIIQMQLNCKRLTQLPGLDVYQHSRALSATGLGDAWLAWRSAREISG